MSDHGNSCQCPACNWDRNNLAADESAKPVECAVSQVSSRMCEHGTMGCEIQHGGPYPVGVVSVTEMDGWHMQPFIGWEKIGYGTKLYANPAPVASKEAVTLSDKQRDTLESALVALDRESICAMNIRKWLAQRDASKAEPTS